MPFEKISSNRHIFPAHPSYAPGISSVVYSLNLYRFFAQACVSLCMIVTGMTILLILIPFSLASKPSKRPKTTRRPAVPQIQPGNHYFSALIYN